MNPGLLWRSRDGVRKVPEFFPSLLWLDPNAPIASDPRCFSVAIILLTFAATRAFSNAALLSRLPFMLVDFSFGLGRNLLDDLQTFFYFVFFFGNEDRR
jgi:hypothetical protein